ncbi:MAG: O-antigen ligase family protein [Thermodesulfobacteriota bacterium]
MPLDKYFRPALLVVLATAPLLFGARHPLIHGLYSCLLLLTAGGWLILNGEWRPGRMMTFGRLVPAMLLLFIGLTALSLPAPLLSLLTPVRAGYLAEAARLADLPDPTTSLSYFAPGTLFYAVYGAALLLLYYFTLALLRSKEMLPSLLWVITLVGVFEAAYGLLQATNPAVGVLWLPSTPDPAASCARGTIIYRNQYAALLNLCWPMALVLGISLYKPALEQIDQPRRRRKDLAPATTASLLMQKAAIPLWSAGMMILALIFSRSRGGILVMVLMAALLLYLLAFPRRYKFLGTGLLLLFIGIYGGAIGFAEVVDRFTTFYESALYRFDLWRKSLDMLWDHVVTGIGMGSYEFLSPAYLQDVPSSLWFDRAHNEYVELTIELGLPAMLLLVAWLAWGMTRAGATLLRTKKKSARPQRDEFARSRRSRRVLRDHRLVAACLGRFCLAPAGDHHLRGCFTGGDACEEGKERG